VGDGVGAPGVAGLELKAGEGAETGLVKAVGFCLAKGAHTFEEEDTVFSINIVILILNALKF